jgi:arylformamidase
MEKKPVNRIIDLSHPLSAETPAFPGDPPVEITVLDSTDRPTDDGSRHLNCSRLHTTVHCGTHMDAPFHFFADRPTIDQVPLDACVGPAVAISLSLREGRAIIERAALEHWADRLRRTRRLVLNTGWHKRWGTPKYFTDHPVITKAAAEFLVECDVVLIGVDFPSVDRPPFPAHEVLLGNDVLIVENLTNLDSLLTSTVQLSAIPLAIVGRDGSPVRAIAIEESAAS